MTLLLKETDVRIVLTGTASDGGYLADIGGIRHERFINTVGELSLVELALLLRKALLFVGPSTGPMHLSTAVGTPVVVFFSPITVQQPRRWGPYHAPGTVLTPQVDCREKYRCRTGCRHYR